MRCFLIHRSASSDLLIARFVGFPKVSPDLLLQLSEVCFRGRERAKVY